MKTKADKHREAGTLEQFRARQAASRQSTKAWQEKQLAEILALENAPSLEDRVAALEHEVAVLKGTPK